MVKKIVALAAFAFLMALFMTTSVTAKAASDKRAARLKAFSFQELEIMKRGLDEGAVPGQKSGRLAEPGSLGAIATPNASAGFTIENTYWDWQYFSKGRHVEYRGTPSIQFAYTDQTSETGAIRYGYNVYDPVAGSWPRGLGVGCEVQASDGGGYYTNLAVWPNGNVVLAGHDDASGNFEVHLYYQMATHSCFWGTGSQIPSATYLTDFHDPSQFLQQPVVAIQIVGTDTITHVAAVEGWGEDAYWATQWRTLRYFRKLGSTSLGTWTAKTIDTVWGPLGDLFASRTSGKVAITYPQPTAEGIEQDQINFDADVYYRQSTDGGVNWGGPVNVTSYQPDVPGHRIWWDISGLYDSDDFMHLVFAATPCPANMYDVGYAINLFINGGSLFHWSDRTGNISRIHNAEWGDGIVPECWGGNSTTNLSRYTISECNGRLYTIWTMFNDGFANPPILDDCHSTSEGIGGGNGEIYLSVSTTLDGLLWDSYRNLTNSYTPGCDSAGWGGECSNDLFATMSMYGMNEADFGTLTWPGGELVDPTPDGDPAYNGTHFLHISYVEDRWPLLFATAIPTNNPLNWIRLACVDPVVAPMIFVSNNYVGFPNYIKHGESATHVITVTNDGNDGLTVGTIGKAEALGGETGWLTVSETALSVGAGVLNTATFDITINENLAINTPGTVVQLVGEVYLLSDAANNDSVTIAIDYLVADTVVGLQFDTVATSATQLALSNRGVMGYRGVGGANLDYTELGDDCDTLAYVYLYDGGPWVAQYDGSEYNISAGMHSSSYTDLLGFKPISTMASPSHETTATWDMHFSGTFVNWDSSLALEATTYAPVGAGDNPAFVVRKVSVFSGDGNGHDNLAFGGSFDWDVPSDDGANNNAYVSTVGNTVYVQGTDDPAQDPPGCQNNANRYAATGFLGWYTNSEFNSDACSNNRTYFGVYGARNDSDKFEIDDTLYAEFLWNKTLANPGQAGITEETDIHTVMTYIHGVNLGAADTITFYTVLTTVRNGTVAELEANLTDACDWYNLNLRDDCGVCGCCVGLTGNVDGDPGDICDIGDLTALIGYLFIPPFTAPECMEEANADGVGSVDIGDLTAMIGYLFIPPFTPPAPC